MWEKLKALSQHPAAQALKKFCGDPVQLYSVFLIMTAMHYYHEDFSWLYTLLALAISFVLMRFYDFVASKRLLGPVCYLIFLALGLYSVGLVTNLGEQSYPLTFFVWFLTPQGVVDFSLAYTIAIYMLMIGFLTSAVYYFAKVRYRMVMQLVIMLIPLSLYAKEGLHMPALLVILLLASFFLLMVYCRQLKENEEVRLIGGFHSGVSIALYVAAFSVIAAIIPKPQFEADREFIDNAMSYSTWSNVLMEAISMFTDSTNNTVSVSNNARTIYYVQSPEPARLRTQTYTYYKADDSWNSLYAYDRPNLDYQEPLTYAPRDLTQAILDAAAADADFARNYGLTDLVGTTLPQQELREMRLYAAWYNSPGLPAPTRMTDITDGSFAKLMRSQTNALFSPNMPRNGAGLQFYSDTFARVGLEAEVLRHLKHGSYRTLLERAQDILQTSDPDAAALLEQVRAEAYDADVLLQTANEKDYHSEVIDSLAADITAGLESDLEKALAIERYFVEQEYVYDLSYQKQPGENIDDFLMTSHTGVCYEFATAMTLLCRSAGLPTRYVQGYNLSERYDSQVRTAQGNASANFVIKMRNAHAFPEVYISGYGWVSFEPTVPSDEDVSTTAENQIVMRWGFVLLVLTLIAVGFWKALPLLRERQFRRRLPGMEPSAAASAAFLRMRTSLRLEDSATVSELGQHSTRFFDDEKLFAELDTLLYDPSRRSSLTSPELAGRYILWQEQRREFEKAEKKRIKEQKKSRVKAQD